MIRLPEIPTVSLFLNSFSDVTISSVSRYVFDNKAPQSAGRFSVLESRYDPVS
jgi:hypothetical protein